MWVTQTYLGDVEPNAKAFVYYLYEEYNDQGEFTAEVQRKLEDLGQAYGNDISLLMPNPRYAAPIECEARDKLQALWWALAGKLPGLLFVSQPLSKFDGETGQYFYIPFDSLDVEGVANAINELRGHANEFLQRPMPSPSKLSAWSKRIYEALELKPNFVGFGIDLKKLSRDPYA